MNLGGIIALFCLCILAVCIDSSPQYGRDRWSLWPPLNVQPEQVHLSYWHGPTEMAVTWVTIDKTDTYVEYGPSKEGVMNKVVKGDATLFRDDGSQKRTMYIHRAIMKDLIPGMEYVYHVGNDYHGWSDVFTFSAMKDGTQWNPRLAFVADMGNYNGRAIPWLQKEIQKKSYDAVIHVGDFAYNMDTDDARYGDAFMRQVESFAAYAPYMTAPGNHEVAYNFSNYRNRFTMPGGDGEGLYYSINIGPIHLVGFSSEMYYFPECYGRQNIAQQYKWLENDLIEANKPENRANQPWIISMCHRPLYCSNSNDYEHCDDVNNLIRVGMKGTHEFGIEDLLYKYGVDVHMQGHEHHYERTWPVYNRKVCNGTSGNPYKNPTATVHIITGSGGNQEGQDPFERLVDPWSAFHSDDFGYTVVRTANNTHLFLDQMSADKGNIVIDSMVIERDTHGAGMFNCHETTTADGKMHVKDGFFKRAFQKL